MKTIDRKAAIAAYKERKPAVGIYLIRCRASGQCWIGASPTLETIQNRHWFTLRQGSFPTRACRRRGATMARRVSASRSSSVLRRKKRTRPTATCC